MPKTSQSRGRHLWLSHFYYYAAILSLTILPLVHTSQSPTDRPRIDNNADLTVTWLGRIIGIEFNDNFNLTNEDDLGVPTLTGGFCLLDISGDGDAGVHGPVSTVPLANSPNLQDYNTQYDPSRWSKLTCGGDKDTTVWRFIGIKGKKGEVINNQTAGWALHDYALGQLKNQKTGRCLAIVRKPGTDDRANIETVPHTLQSAVCDSVGEDDRQMWMVYFHDAGQPFSPFIPAMYTGACFKEGRGANVNNNEIADSPIIPVDGAVYIQYSVPNHLRRVDAKYVAISTFDKDDHAGVSPVVACTGQKWFFDPPFTTGGTVFNETDPNPNDGDVPDYYDGSGDPSCTDYWCPPKETPGV
ncbi:hypothetical protein AA313_de0202035 [Arthrobotrys entomopaga]|nr:hypothetical protein AA313_de0202035 [Arthrobotrys entomopaga]